jgi:hypothetical protein
MAEVVKFYQIYFHEKHLTNLFRFATPYYNDTLTPFFENTVIKNLVLGSESDKIAITSHALRNKMRLNLRPLTENVLYEDFDVLSLTRNSKFHKMLAAAEVWHPGFTDLLGRIMHKIGFGDPVNPKYPIYQNAFIARTNAYKRYVEEFLVPAMEVMENDTLIRKLCWQDSQYTKLKTEPLSDKAKKDLGVGYYPMHPFVCERFFSQWLDKQKLNVQYL